MVSVRCITVLVLVAMTCSVMANTRKPHYNLDDAPALFEKFIVDYKKHYVNEADKAAHYQAFVRNLARINKANSNKDDAVFGINKFTDISPEDFAHQQGFHPLSGKKH